MQWLKGHRVQLGIFAMLVLGMVSTAWLVVNGESTTNPGGRWRPAPNQSWQWQLTGEIDTSFEVDVYDVDLFDASEETVRKLIDGNAWVVCYLSAGTVEDWRPDAGEFPAEVVGEPYEGWEGERWLDIRQIDLLAPVLEARLDLCEEKGFDGVEADNLDGYLHDTGFGLTAEDAIAFARWLATEAHDRGLAIGLKNVPELAAELEADFDFAVAEECFAQGWCEDLAVFLEERKPVFAAEYTDSGIDREAACAAAEEMEFSLVVKERDLGPYREGCE